MLVRKSARAHAHDHALQFTSILVCVWVCIESVSDSMVLWFDFSISLLLAYSLSLSLATSLALFRLLVSSCSRYFSLFFSIPPNSSHSFLYTIYATKTKRQEQTRNNNKNLFVFLWSFYLVCQKRHTHIIFTSVISHTKSGYTWRANVELHKKNSRGNPKNDTENSRRAKAAAAAKNTKHLYSSQQNVLLFLMWYVFVVFVWWKCRRWCYYT